jgi:hypothetical protein
MVSELKKYLLPLNMIIDTLLKVKKCKGKAHPRTGHEDPEEE